MERLVTNAMSRLARHGIRVTLLLLAGLAATPVHPEVVRLEILSRESFAAGQTFGTTGSYEKLRGRLHYAVDPNNPANARIVDLRLAPRDREGRVVFTGDFLLLKPTDLAKGNHRLLYEVNNRGNLGMLGRFNRGESNNDPSTPAHAGNGFLLRQGYTLLWSAWNWDVQPGESRLQIELPIATENGGPITGRIVAEITVNEPSQTQPFAWGNSRGYAVVDPTDNRGATLTVRDEQTAPRVEVPRDQWRFSDATHLSLPTGFEPGRIYELVYETRDPRVVGLGLAAIRDTLSFFRFAPHDAADHPNPLTRGTAPDPQKALIFGISQSGRVIQHMLFDGLHVDEAGRPAFDAALIHVPGGGKGSFNHRFAQTTRHPSEHEDHQYPADYFPFGTTPQTDPVTGETGDVLARARAAGRIPYLFYTGTSTEYWARSASLLHTDVTGTRDTPVDEHVRIYFIAGAQHGIGAPGERGEYANPANPLDHSPPLRALLLALDRWASSGEKPPDSVYPRIDRGELVTVVEHNRHFPKVPGVVLAGANLRPPRLDLGLRFHGESIIDVQPPRFGAAYDTLVPDVDPDGNERAGIRLPDVAAPLGTYAGWNLRTSAMGASRHLARWSGSFLTFAATEVEREQRGDPRPSIAARYPTHAAYVERVTSSAEGLRGRGLLLPEDVAAYVEKARALAWPPEDPPPSEPEGFHEVVIVSAARGEQKVGEATSLVTVVSAADLADSPALTLDDQLRRVPGFSLLRRSSGMVAQPTTQGVSLRGIGPSGSSRSLVLWDGIPLNDPFGGWIYWNRIPVLAVESVEIVRGSTSQLYGSAAMGGTIAIRPRTGDRGRVEVRAQGGTRGTYDVDGVASGSRDGWQGLLAARAFDTQGYFVVDETIRGPVDTRAATSFQNLLARTSRGGFRASVNLFREERANGTEVQVNDSGMALVAAGYRRGAVGLDLYSQVGRFNASYSRILPNRSAEFLTLREGLPTEAYGASFTWRPGSRILTGADWRRVESKGRSQDLAGLFVQGLLPLAPRLDLQVGGRLDTWDNRTTRVSANPRGGLLWRAADTWTVRASAYRGFRAPTLNELYRPFRVGNVSTLPNDSLDEERLWGTEVGAEYHPSRSVLLRLNGFWNALHDPVANVTLSSTPTLITRQRQNLGGATIRGLEADLSWRAARRWQARVSYLFSHALVDETDLRIPQVPRHQATAIFEYDGPVKVAVEGRLIGDQYEDDRNEFVLGRYGVLGVRVGRPLNARFELFVAAENLLDRKYEVGRTPTPTLGAPRLVHGGVHLRLR